MCVCARYKNQFLYSTILNSLYFLYYSIYSKTYQQCINQNT